MGYTDGKALGSNEGIKLGLSGSEVIGTILGNVDRITPGIDIETYMVSLDGYFDSYNDGKFEGLLIGDSLESTYGKVFGSNEGIKLGSTDGEVLGIIIRDVDGITIGLDVGT